ncbi:WG repeat-containing protein [Isobaculum melis]|uniref:WG containing repeat-containing protein n=1 Tax=Isobaculum melis TaxID=142588 RepID=A0A1H9QDX7_9LACT|nr:WG repeat-containing protein [Isobaculum melis]SER58664.1 WG containing repeat-containing protein [Isobaculum melis]
MSEKSKKVNEALRIVYDSSTGLQGIKDEAGKEIVSCIYEDILYVKIYHQFIIKKNARYGIIDAQGHIIAEAKYLHIIVSHYIDYVLEDGYYIQSEKGFGRISTSGQVIVKPKYSEIETTGKFFYEASIDRYTQDYYYYTGKQMKETINELNDGYFCKLIKQDGQYLSQLFNKKFEMINNEVTVNFGSRYSNGYLQVNVYDEEDNRHLGYIDAEGKIITKAYYDGGESFSKDGLAVVYQDDKYGVIDTKGNLIIPLAYDAIHDFHEGYGIVKKNNKWGAFDTQGHEILPIIYDALSNHHHGGFIYLLGNEDGWVDIKNNRYQLITQDDGETFFYYDKNGNKAPLHTVDEAFPFLGEGLEVSFNKKKGLIDKVGKTIVNPVYDQISSTLLGGIGFARKGKYWGIITEDGTEATDFIYDNIGFLAPGYCVGRKDSKCTLLSKQGAISENIFDYIGSKNEVGIFWTYAVLSERYVPISANDYRTFLHESTYSNIHALEIKRDKLSFKTDLGYLAIDGQLTEIINPLLSKKQTLHPIEESIPSIIEESGMLSLKNKIGKIPSMYNYTTNTYYVETYQKEMLDRMSHYENRFLLGLIASMTKWAFYRIKDVTETYLNTHSFQQRIQSLYVGSFRFDYVSDNFDWYGGFSEKIATICQDAKEASKLDYLSKIDFQLYNMYRFHISRSSARFIGQSTTEVYAIIRAGLPKKYQIIFEKWVLDVLERAKPYCYQTQATIYSESVIYDEKMDQLVSPQFYFDQDYVWDRLENEQQIKDYISQESIKENPYLDLKAIEANPLSFFA